jgi:HNH endonuclease
VYSKRTNRILKTTVLKSGYLTISTRIGGRTGKAVCFRVHRLVADAFIPVPEKLRDYARKTKYGVIPVNHIDNNKLNNTVNNLEWCTYSENSIHYVLSPYFSNSHCIGENNFNSKLTNLQREEIFRLRTDGMLFADISLLFGVHKVTARSVYLSILKQKCQTITNQRSAQVA